MIMRPDFQPQSLEKTLKRLGMRRLAELVGPERLDAIDDVIAPSITETALTKILLLRHGTQILANKDVRKAVLSSLPDPLLGYISDGHYREGLELSPGNRNSVLSMIWSRSSTSSNRTLFVFGLNKDYLPPVTVQRPDHEVIRPQSILYPYQRRVKDRLVRFLIDNNDRVLLHMPTGAGKTRTSIEGIVDYWRSVADRDGFVVWLAHSEELCEQAYESFTKLWAERGDSPVDMYRLWGPHSVGNITSMSHGFIVASLQKIHSMRTTQSNEVFKAIATIKSKCRMIIIDEAHKAIAPTYKAGIEYISNINKTKVLGLTATPGRGFDEAETQELVDFFGGNKITITDESGVDVPDPIRFLQSNGYLAHINRKPVSTNVDIDLTEKERQFVATFLDVPPSVLKKLSEDAERNALILAEIGDLYARGRYIIVFALSVEHAHLLTELLMLREIEARCIDGATPSHDRRAYIEEYKSGKINILINYGVLTTGFDAPNTNAVVITRPTGSLVLYSQMIGRGIRGPKMGGNADCELVDMKDNLVGFPEENLAFSYFNDAWLVS